MSRIVSLKYHLLSSFFPAAVSLFLTGGITFAQEVTDPLIKTGLLHKFAQHIEWPQEEDIDTFRIGIYGQEPELMSNLLLLESVELKGKPVTVRQFSRLGDISFTHLLYVASENNAQLERIANQIEGNSTLLVSDRVRKQEQVMINFLPLRDGKADFEINSANIINANLKITPDLLLLGGTEVDIAGLYKESQRGLQRLKSQIEDLSESFRSKSQQIETLNLEIEKQNRELEIQKELFDAQSLQITQQQEEMEASAKQLADVLKEVEIKQLTLDSKIELIETQELEIETQKKDIENQNKILKDLEQEIGIKERSIEQQESQLSNYANIVARQKTFLFIIIAISILIAGLVFFIYRSYRIKKNANREIEEKNRELRQRQEEIIAQSEEIRQANEEVVATNEALEAQKSELQFTLENLKMTQSQLIQSEKMASLGLLTAGIAHELNNPINFVKGNVNPLQRDMEEIFTLIEQYDDLIKANNLEKVFDRIRELKEQMDYGFLLEEVNNLLLGIQEGADRSSSIVKGLRSFSRLDDEKFQLYNIHDGIDSTLILLTNKIKNTIKIHKEYGDLREIECLPSKLNQVFMNILTNCIQAIEDKGEIFIQTVSSDISVKIIIKDTGTGMSPEVKAHIFEPFYTTKEVGKGTGLGLSITYGIIEQHHGNIDVISEPGIGTEFIISLPRKQSDIN
ncbi:MAG: YfiR/HmsC family protein [bacterium]